MLKINKITFVISTLSIALVILFIHARNEAHLLHRDPDVLMNRYYLLHQTKPDAARKALSIILQQDPHYLPALKELSQLFINEHKVSEALPLMLQLHQLKPLNLDYTLHLARLYYEQGEWEQAHILLMELKNSSAWSFKIEAQHILNQMASSVPNYQNKAQRTLQNNKENESSTVVTILLNHFYMQRTDSPKKAEQLLSLLELLGSNNATVYLEQGYLALQKKEPKQGIALFLQAYNLNPTPEIALQLAYLYASADQKKESAHFFLIAMNSADHDIKGSAAKGYSIVAQTNPIARSTLATNKAQSTPESLLMDQFYLLKKKNKKAAWQLIKRFVDHYPDHLAALKEGGFLAIELKHRNEAIHYFSRAYNLSYQADLAMQLGYLYDQPNGSKATNMDKYWAYHYFHLATHTHDKKLELRAQNAMTNLSGLQTKGLPDPFFNEVFFDPFSQDRFGLTVRPFVGRLGIEHDNRWQSKSYLLLRRTQDNKSINAGQISQIYEDNVQILGLGEQITPIPSFPLVGFIEAGRAYDLVYRNRNRWRNDVRAGFMYYNEFGAQPEYYEHMTANAHYYSTLYGDATYFSRYNNNIIATLKTHQGLRLLQYRSSMLNLYVTGRVIEDTRREFFNNIAEIGPGVGFIPSNRFKVELRFEHINGMYLPAGRTVNPYGKYYTNNTVQLFFYTKL
jgi:thioredoxin-like negative regulator of GroEL